MPVYEYQCCECCDVVERIFFNEVDVLDENCVCGGCMKRIFPTKAPKFKLVYNNKTDICDWNGNTSRYWDEYKNQKAEGKNVRIPELDGDK